MNYKGILLSLVTITILTGCGFDALNDAPILASIDDQSTNNKQQQQQQQQ